MTEKQKEQFNRMAYALRIIHKDYETPKQLFRNSRKNYGLDYDEALEMAYENIQQLAKLAVKGVKTI